MQYALNVHNGSIASVLMFRRSLPVYPNNGHYHVGRVGPVRARSGRPRLLILRNLRGICV
jgi:hypothetical protein